MTGRLRASILVIGDEILGGFVADTNSGWLAGRLQTLGVPLDRIVTIPDEMAAIDEALATELGRSRPRVVLTSGGIGSTPDDLTMAAVAAHLGVALETEPTIDERITAALERNATRGALITPEHERSMRKMAQVPAGADLLGGALAPGVAVDVDHGSRAGGATIVILPGIPSELRRLVTDAVEPQLLDDYGTPDHVVELTHPYPESALNPTLDRLVAEFPELHVGSYPAPECIVRLKGPEPTVTAAAAVVRRDIDALAASPGADELARSWAAYWT